MSSCFCRVPAPLFRFAPKAWRFSGHGADQLAAMDHGVRSDFIGNVLWDARPGRSKQHCGLDHGPKHLDLASQCHGQCKL